MIGGHLHDDVQVMLGPDTVYGGFWRRVGAGLIDAIAFLPSILILPRVEGISFSVAIIAALIAQAYYFVYTLGLTFKYGGTLGKLALDMRVRPADGTQLRWKHVWRRNAVDIVFSYLGLFSTIIGLSRVDFAAYSAADFLARNEMMNAAVPWLAAQGGIYFAWIVSEFVVLMTNRRRRALHDFIGGTVVIVVRDPTQRVVTDATLVSNESR